MVACSDTAPRNHMVTVVPTYMLGPLGAVSMLVLFPVMGCGDVRGGLLLNKAKVQCLWNYNDTSAFADVS